MAGLLGFVNRELSRDFRGWRKPPLFPPDLIAAAMVTGELRCASGPPHAIAVNTAPSAAIAHLEAIKIQPELLSLDCLSRTPAIAPSARKICTDVPYKLAKPGCEAYRISITARGFQWKPMLVPLTIAGGLEEGCCIFTVGPCVQRILAGVGELTLSREQQRSGLF